ncbi:MAG TPA: hypothetical protein VHP37_24015 [Burkholderiales bacterium]|nr:hypothetical protein [Burkholderiales bacterium]
MLTAALAGAGALAYTYSGDEKTAARKATAHVVAAATATAQPAAPEQPAGPALPTRGGLAETGSSLFSSHSWEPPPPKVKPGPPPPPPKPVAPPLPYTFAGRMLQDGTVYVFLARGDRIITAKQGDTLEGVYRVDSISETQVSLIYVPLNEKQTLAVVSSLPRALSPFAEPRPSAPAPQRAEVVPQSTLR